MNTTAIERINGLDVGALRDLIDRCHADPANAMTRWSVTTRWQGGTVSKSQVRGCGIGDRYVPREFSLMVDEPLELGGTNLHANPQEYLLASLNACMTAGFVAVAALHGVELESLEIETKGDIDLRGFFEIDPTVKPGYDSLHYIIRLRSSAPREKLQEIHDIVVATSPNRFNIATPIRLTSELVLS